MEKEEESESHLQKVINARQNFNESGKGIVIPIPEATIPVHHYPTVYKVTSTIPSTYIRVPGLGLKEDIPDYDLDSEDEEWLSAQSKERVNSFMLCVCVIILLFHPAAIISHAL
jgi:enhancer of polycomb-like protein